MAKKLPKSFVKNPLLEVAQGLYGQNDDEKDVWEEEPVSIEEFVESKTYLNQKWNGRTGCRPKILEILHQALDPAIREIILLLGKGSGKDYASSIMHLYGIYRCLCMYNPQAYFGLAPSPIYFVNTARNDTQAKKVFFTQFRLLLTDCPWFKGKYNEPGLQSVSFIKNIEAISVNSQAFGWLGYNTIQWVGDELAFFLESDDDDESESRAQMCWEAAYGSCKTRFNNDYKMIGITTPRYDDDFVMRKFEELKIRDDGYSAQAATWDVNPNLTKEDFKIDFDRDPRRTMRDFGAVPQGVIESFWPEPDTLEHLVCAACKKCPVWINRKSNTVEDPFTCFDYEDCTANPYMGNGQWRDWLRPPPEYNEFWMHFDTAKTKDRFCFGLGGVTGETKVELSAYHLKMRKRDTRLEAETEDDKFEIKPLIKIFALGWVTAKSKTRDLDLLVNDEYDFTKIMNKTILHLSRKGFNIVGATADQFQSLMFQQTLEAKGYETDLISLDRTDEIPIAAKYALLENRVEYPYSFLLCHEAKYLKHIGGKKVDHSKKSSKDVWDALAGTIWNCEMRIGTGGTFVGLDQDQED